MSRVDQTVIKASGVVVGIKQIQDQQLQLIIGPRAELINNEIIAHKGAALMPEFTAANDQ